MDRFHKPGPTVLTHAHINQIATAVPEYEVHDYFLRFATASLAALPKQQKLFRRMADKAGIESRYSCIEPADDPDGQIVDRSGIFRRGAFPGTAKRMDMYESAAAELAMLAIDRLDRGDMRTSITHLIVASCTGLSAENGGGKVGHGSGGMSLLRAA
ncbi:hypothetical protein [uncultured Jannaschia sp.]|uniref:hypothetical protein n=1 Tax=uncultured Jannaschia sp. TaxID=293347 RepID=UPI002607CDA6|nr:hypothetical protein [uncultured Jannaschia sp.]